MFKKIRKIFYISSFFIFVILIGIFYFSEQNIILTNKSRSLYSDQLKNNAQDLILLKNNTENIIEYKDDVEIYKKNKKKYKFWNLLKNN